MEPDREPHSREPTSADQCRSGSTALEKTYDRILITCFVRLPLLVSRRPVFTLIWILLFLRGKTDDCIRFVMTLVVLSGYPYQSPTVKFVTPCFHPNVDTHGNICLDILKEKWSALYEVNF